MKNVTTHDLIQSLCIAIERRVRADCVLTLSKRAITAREVKARQREERHALTALNNHLRECEAFVKKRIKKR